MTAVFSECRKYRYRLDRKIGNGPPLAFLLHNPSTAAEVADDNTSRRGIGFAYSFGAGRLIFINPWALIATKPRDLWAAEDPVGVSNDEHIDEVIREVKSEGGLLVGAWGKVAPPAARRQAASERIREVLKIVRSRGSSIVALGVNLDGSPKHPLYVRKDSALSVWQPNDSHGL